MSYNTNSRRLLIGIASIAILLVMVCAAFAGTTNRRRDVRFEYKTLTKTHITEQTASRMKQQSQGSHPRGAIEKTSFETVEFLLNQLGEEGWELASCTDEFYILKRRAK